MYCSGPVISSCVSFKMRGWMLSGPAALDIFWTLSFFMTSSFCMTMLVSVSSTSLGSNVGVSVTSSFVKTRW